jgi:hypothetical protein
MPLTRFRLVIIFDLTCVHGHRFEGWFASSEEFDRQKNAMLVTCPVCDDVGIERVPSAQVRIPRAAGRESAAPEPVDAESAPSHDVVAGMPEEVLSRLREIVRNTENVGRRFPEEARKIHYNEAPARSIRGQASRDEAQELKDEGIDFAQLPPFLSRDTH